MIKKEKNKNIVKKRLILGASSILVITVCGTIGWKVIKSTDLLKQDDVIEHSFLTGQDIEKGYVDIESDSGVNTNSDTGDDTQTSEVDVFNDEITRKQADSYLAKLGFGYTLGNVVAYAKENYEEQLENDDRDAYDKDNATYRTSPEKFYMWYTNMEEEDRPEYSYNVSSKVEVYEVDTSIDKKILDKQQYVFTVTVKVSSRFSLLYDDEGVVKEWVQGKTESKTFSDIEVDGGGGNLPDDILENLKQQTLEGYKETSSYTEMENRRKEIEENYEKWKAYRDKRNEWLQAQKDAGYFDEKGVNGSDSVADQDYRAFWFNVARKALQCEGLTTAEMIDKLYGQIKDEDGNDRNVGNILDTVVISGETYNSYPSYSGGNGGSGESPDGGSGSTPGGSTPGGSTPGGTTPGGTTPGGTTPGGTTPGGDNNTPGEDSSDDKNVDGDDYEEVGDKKDTVAAKVKTVALTYPTSGSYSKGQKIQVKVTFDKKIYGTIEGSVVDKDSAPKFLVTIGASEAKEEMEFESASGANIVYSYIVKENDNGTLLLAEGKNFEGVIYNASGIPTIIEKVDSITGAESVKIDNVAPVVKAIETISSETTYDVGKEVKVKVTFDEPVYTAKNKVPIVAETAPVFKASFGSGEERTFTFDSYSEKENSIIYKYTITEKDIGKLKIDIDNVFDATREICDESGTSIKISKGVELTGTEIIVNPEKPRIELNKENIVLDLKDKVEGQELTTTLTATLIGLEEDSKITWSAANIDVASVDSNGLVKAKKVGQAIIVARVFEGSNILAEAKCNVTVKDTSEGETVIQIKDSIIEIDKNKSDGEVIDLKVDIVGENGEVVKESDQKVTYTSKDESIAKVIDGKIIPVSPGKTEITITTEDGTKKDVEVIITNSSTTEIEPTAVTTELSTITIDPLKTKEIVLEFSLEPKNSNKKTKMTYISSDENVATVDENGKVTIKGKGTAVIMAITENGKKAYTTINAIDLAENTTLSSAQNGDYNSDKNVDTADLLVMLRHIAASRSSEIAEKHQKWIVLDDKYYLLDVNKDGKVDVSDVLKLQRHIAASKSENIANEHKDWLIK